MKLKAWLLLAALACGCARTVQTEQLAPGRDEVSTDTFFIVGSAAAPTGGDKVPDHIYKVLEKATASLNEMEVAEALTTTAIQLQDPDYVLVCHSAAPPSGESGFPILACGMGPFVNTPYAFALFWRDGVSWRSQLYPQAPADTAIRRREYFSALGANCPIGCGATFKVLRQQGTKLLVVVDLSGVKARPNQEVHLLEWTGTEWKILWVPIPDSYRLNTDPRVATNNPRVILPKEGIDKFEVHYNDGTKTAWIRHDTAFVPQ
jgi:hypothetical protein